jgi:hypothetical protein
MRFASFVKAKHPRASIAVAVFRPSPLLNVPIRDISDRDQIEIDIGQERPRMSWHSVIRERLEGLQRKDEG